MPKHTSPAPVVENAFAGTLVGFLTPLDAQAPALCDLCASDAPQYRQIFVADGSTYHAPFTNNYGAGFSLGTENTLTIVAANYLDTLPVPVHAEVTYTLWYTVRQIPQ